jgi:hypothetical protein
MDLTREQGRELQRVNGQATYRVLERLFASERYQQLNDERGLGVIEKAIDRTRREAAPAIRRSIGRTPGNALPIPAPPMRPGTVPISPR